MVAFNRPLCREHFLLRMRVTGPAPFPATQPGQFIQLGCRTPNGFADADAIFGQTLDWEPGQVPSLAQAELCGRVAFLRRPFSLAGRGDECETGGGNIVGDRPPAEPGADSVKSHGHATWLEVIHRVVGVGTQWLSQLQPGDSVDLIGPLGNQFTLTQGKSLALLVGGGVGLPPMFYLAEALRRAGWDAVAFVGAMTRDLLAVTFRDDVQPDAHGSPRQSVQEFARHNYPAVITTDDGSHGLRGRITAGLERVLHSLSPADLARAVVFTCGPEPMMHAVSKLAKAHHVDCQVCLEQAMACGMATCQSCIVKIEDAKKPHGTTEHGRPWRFKLACTDGPVFPAEVVVW